MVREQALLLSVRRGLRRSRRRGQRRVLDQQPRKEARCGREIPRANRKRYEGWGLRGSFNAINYFVIMSFAASPVGTTVHSTDMAEVVRAKTDLSVLIPALDEGPNLAILLPWLNRILDELQVSYEVIVITKEDDSQTISAAAVGGAEVLTQVSNGYGGALIDGLKRSRGEFVLTLDADLSHRPDFVRRMWDSRSAADITIASRYVPGGTATMPKARLYLSRVLNLVFRRGLSVPVLDLSSGFRLYRRSCIDPDGLSGADFDVLEEILVKAFCDGWRVQEIPFDYMPREQGTSQARVVRLGRAYLRAFWHLWKLRNSIAAADYDYRAFDSPIPLQRYWQRSRFRIASELVDGQGLSSMWVVARAASSAACLRAASPWTFSSGSFGLTVALAFPSCMRPASICRSRTPHSPASFRQR